MSTIFTVSRFSGEALWQNTTVVVRTFMLSFVVLATLSMSPITAIWSSNSFHESMFLPPIASSLSPFIMPAFAAGEFGITLSMSAGMNGFTNTGCSLSMVSRLMSSGMVSCISLPWRITVTVCALAMSRYMSTSNFVSVFSLVRSSTSPSLKPIFLAASLNFIPIVILSRR